MTTPQVLPTNDTRSRAWVFTHNNYTQEDHNNYFRVPSKYIIVGKEVAPTTGTRHLQGYIYFKDAKSFAWLRKKFPRAVFNVARGTPEQNYVYCSKGEDFQEAGEKPLSQAEKGQKGKEKCDAMWSLAKEGKFFELPPQSIKTWEYIHMKYGAKAVDRDILSNKWIWGPSGCGKSRFVRDSYPKFYNKPMSKWWDGYAGEDTIVLDDFAPEHGKYLGYFLKIWADHYAFNAEIKGGMLNIRPLVVIITSQYPIHRCFEEPETVSAITRRFEVVELGREHLQPDLTAQL